MLFVFNKRGSAVICYLIFSILWGSACSSIQQEPSNERSSNQELIQFQSDNECSQYLNPKNPHNMELIVATANLAPLVGAQLDVFRNHVAFKAYQTVTAYPNMNSYLTCKAEKASLFRDEMDLENFRRSLEFLRTKPSPEDFFKYQNTLAQDNNPAPQLLVDQGNLDFSFSNIAGLKITNMGRAPVNFIISDLPKGFYLANKSGVIEGGDTLQLTVVRTNQFFDKNQNLNFTISVPNRRPIPVTISVSESENRQ